MTTEGLRITALGVQRGSREVLSGVDVHAPFGSVTALVGPNGAGKTTLLSAAAGLVPSRGRIELAGKDLASLDRRTRAQCIAYVPQMSLLSARLSVLEVVSMGRYAHGGVLGKLGSADRAQVEQALEQLDIGHLLQRPFPDLSGGEQRRVLLARALATGARALLLDEPTASLDIGHALSLTERLRELAAQGRCVVVVLHDLSEVTRVADHVVLLDNGRVLASGPIRSVIADGPVRRAYGVRLIEGGGFGYRMDMEHEKGMRDGRATR